MTKPVFCEVNHSKTDLIRSSLSSPQKWLIDQGTDKITSLPLKFNSVNISFESAKQKNVKCNTAAHLKILRSLQSSYR